MRTRRRVVGAFAAEDERALLVVECRDVLREIDGVGSCTGVPD
jgi:hypothetical protein